MPSLGSLFGRSSHDEDKSPNKLHKKSKRESLPYQDMPPSAPPQMGTTPLPGNGVHSPDRPASMIGDSRTSQGSFRPMNNSHGSPRSNNISNGSSAARDTDVNARMKGLSIGSPTQQQSLTTTSEAGSGFNRPLTNRQDRFGENVADWNIIQSQQPVAPEHMPPSLNTRGGQRTDGVQQEQGTATQQSRNQPEQDTPTQQSRYQAFHMPTRAPRGPTDSASPADRDRGTVPRKAVSGEQETPQDSVSLSSFSDYAAYLGSARTPSSERGRFIDEADLHASSPIKAQTASASAATRALQSNSGHHQPSLPSQQDHLAPQKAYLNDVVDLSNTARTTVVEKIAPAVTHETIHQEIHHIREEKITREIHTHNVHHRILPIVDVQVLPARHYVPVNDRGDLVEIDPSQIPGRAAPDGRAGAGMGWVIAETVSKAPAAQPQSRGQQHTGSAGKGKGPRGAHFDEDPVASVSTSPSASRGRKSLSGNPIERLFSARTFGPNEGRSRAWTDENGVARSHQTWIHAPTHETGAQRTGQSVPFYFNDGDGYMEGDNADGNVKEGMDYLVPDRVENIGGRPNFTSAARGDDF